MLVVFGSDHAGLTLKAQLKAYVETAGHSTQDLGTFTLESCDYPNIAAAVARKVVEAQCLGVLICGSGIGMSMAANRFPGIRAALCTNEYMARMSRLHNNANILCLGERILGLDLAKAIVEAFVATPFEGGRHLCRIQQMDAMPLSKPSNPL